VFISIVTVIVIAIEDGCCQPPQTASPSKQQWPYCYGDGEIGTIERPDEQRYNSFTDRTLRYSMDINWITVLYQT
jgi:hypothetical protein